MRRVAIGVVLAAGCAEPTLMNVEYEQLPVLGGTGTALELCDDEPIDTPGVYWAVAVDDALHLRIGHGSGCGWHHHRLCWNGEIDTSEALPRASLRLIYETNNTCEAFTAYPLDFSLAPLRDAWRELAGYRADQILIELELDSDWVMPVFYAEGERGVCNPLASDCPDPEQSCLHVATSPESSLACVDPVVTNTRYAPCDPTAPCEAGTVCAPSYKANEGGCKPLCDLQAPVCPDEADVCTPWEAPGGRTGLGVCLRAE